MRGVRLAGTYHRGSDLADSDRGAVEQRDIHAIDRELELLAAVAAAIRRLGGTPNTTLIDELLDERITTRSRSGARHHCPL